MDISFIEKAINNLINNALKFTPQNGNVNINMELNDNLQILISDNGIGIPTEDIENVFNRFYQAKNHITKSKGSGIGLSFTKEIIDAHDFYIHVKSEPNIKTTFAIGIPDKYLSNKITKTPNENILNQNKKTTSQITPKHHQNTETILIVDDHEQMRKYLASVLNNYNILKAENGKEALKVINNNTIDLLVTDYMMPIMDGDQLVKEIKKMKLKIPIIVLTARTDNEAKIKMLRVGVDGYLNKPFTEEELKLHVKNSLKLYQNIILENSKISTYEKNTIDKYSEEFNKNTIDFIINNISNSDFSIKSLADYLHISQSTLNRRTKNIFGLTAQEFILQIKLQTAKKLILNHPNLTKQEIGYKVGVNNTSYLFKKLEDIYGTAFSINNLE